MIFSNTNGVHVGWGIMETVLSSIPFNDETQIVTLVDTVIEIDEKGEISIKWCYYLTYKIMPVFDLYCRHQYSIIDNTKEPDKGELRNIITQTYSRFEKELKVKMEDYKIPTKIEPISSEEVEQVLQQLLAKLLPLVVS